MQETKNAQEKLRKLRQILEDIPQLAVSFSGGIDSALLLKVAVDTMGSERVLAITARGVNFPERESGEADTLARSLGVRHVHVDFDALSLPEFVENSPERCYYCKKRLFGSVFDIAKQHGIDVVADGANVDDMGDYRPGMRATAELGVTSPLRDAGLGKREIRELLRTFGVEDWDKPSLACLASRIPYGMEIRREDLEMVDRAETFLLGMGIRNVRVRHHGELARIEVESDERAVFFDEKIMDRIHDALRETGYAYVTLDLHGYRTGSMNERLPDPASE